MAYQSINPFTEETLKSFPEHSHDEVERVLTNADRAYREDWRRLPFEARSAVLRRAAATLRENYKHFASLATIEMGKLFREAVAEVNDCADIFEYYAEHAASILAPTEIDLTQGHASVASVPLGIIFCIEPWNYPYYQMARVVAPNLMAGNTIVLKHASGVPQCALAVEALLQEAGAPSGVYTNLFVTNEQAAAIISDNRVRGVALTGSERAGTSVASTAGKSLKKSTMELGGSDAFIVLNDANLEDAIRLAVAGRMQNTGQACAGAKRFIIEASIADAFIAGFKKHLEMLSPGDPFSEHTTLAPLSSKTALELAVRQIEDAVAGGAKVLLGGMRLDRTGFFLAPTLLTDVEASNPAFSLEFFAPVAMIFRVNDEKEAVALANNSPFGLGGSVISTNIDRAKRVAEQMDTGMVFINSTVVSVPELPFGGVKNSGFGRELSDFGINEFVSKKLVLTANPTC